MDRIVQREEGRVTKVMGKVKGDSCRCGIVAAVKNERGSMSLLAIGTLALVIIVSVYLFYFFTVFIEKRQAQNIADAASLTAVQTIREEYEEAMQDKAERELQQFLLEYDELLNPPASVPDTEEEASTPENGSEPGDGEAGSDIPTLPTIKLEDLIDSLELRRLIKDGGFDKEEHWPLVAKESYFSDQFTARKNGDLLYDVIRRESGKVESVAREAVTANKGKAGGSLTFPVEGEPKFLLKATRTMKLDSVGFEKDIITGAAAGISSKEVPIDVSGKPPFTIYW
ncbi:pilus assembly protein TadG-related protein [Paenibacillus sp. 2TAB23]|uniref:pilus assembly protein TadG-related protein n=1 Tax=Paenibacillus sp. 2TAB23 TaxID=3233004 RepID=UPI003F9D79DA